MSRLDLRQALPLAGGMFPIRDHNPSSSTPIVTYALLALNIAIFLLYFPAGSDRSIAEVYYSWGMIPAHITDGGGQTTLLTSMFLHGGWMHLAGNMLFLWIFGDNLEDTLGPFVFLLFYLLCGLVASAAQIAWNPSSPVPTVGASGAIAGVLGGYLLLFPRAKVDILLILVIFFRVFSIPAWITLGIWFGMQIFGGLSAPAPGGGVAYWAHAGGFIAGLLLMVPVWMGKGATDYWMRTDYHPPHPEASYKFARSSIPKVGKK